MRLAIPNTQLLASWANSRPVGGIENLFTTQGGSSSLIRHNCDDQTC